MQMTVRSLLLLLIVCPVLAAATISWFFLVVAGVWLAIYALALVTDWQLSPRPSDWSWNRIHEDRLSLAVANRIEVRIHLHRGVHPVRVWLRDTPPATFAIDPGEQILVDSVGPGSTHEFTYDVTPPRRGDYRFGNLFLRWESVLGLFRRQTSFAAAANVKVYPNLVDVRKYDLLMRRNRLWELGLRSIRRLGNGTEFERLRDYSPDDEYRRINWKATARRGKPITMEYESERSQNLFALLDVGRMMRSPIGPIAKMDYAINAVLLLAYVATQKGDRLGLLTFADGVQQWLAPGSGKGQFHRLLAQLYAVEGQAVEPNYYTAFNYFAARQQKRSLVLVFTDLTGSISTEALIQQMTALRKRHLPLLVTVSDPTVQRLARQEIRTSSQLYERTAAEQLVSERALTLQRLHQRGVYTLDVSAEELTVAVINRYLALKEQMLI